MEKGLVEIMEQLKSEYDDKVSKVVGFGTRISDIKCDFCGKKTSEVKKMIAGDRVFICNECVEICMEIVKDETE